MIILYNKMKVGFTRTAVIIGVLLFFSPKGASASSTQPNLQEMRAQHELDLMKMQKEQQAAMFVKQRDELFAGLKSLVKAKGDVYKQMKTSEHDYKTAKSKFDGLKKQLDDLEGKIGQLQQQSTAQISVQVKQQQLNKYHDAQNSVLNDIKNVTKVQQDSYASMQAYDAQYRNFTAKEQVLRQQIENAQRQLQFIMSQP